MGNNHTFSGPTPPNVMQEGRSGYGYAECGRCGHRHRVEDDLSPQNPIFEKSPDGHLTHLCDKEPYNWPVRRRERAKLRLSATTALAEIDRWCDVLERCADLFSPEDRDHAVQHIGNLRSFIDTESERLERLIANTKGLT